MRRECSESEKLILRKNTKQILSGIVSSGVGPIIVFGLIGLAIGAAVGAFGALLLPDLLMDLDVVGEVLLNIIVRVAAFGMMVVAAVIGSRIGAKIRTRKIFSSGRFYINGATYLGPMHGTMVIAEDDYTDPDGKYYAYRLPCPEYAGFKRGDRLLLVARDDGAVFLMRPVGEVGQILKSFIGEDIERMDTKAILHPNMANIDEERRMLTEDEKKRFVRTYRNFARTRLVIGGICTTILALIIVGLPFVFIAASSDAELIPIELIVAVLCFIGLSVFFIWGMSKLNSRILKKITHVKKVIYAGFGLEMVGPSYVNVFEKNGNEYGPRSVMTPGYSPSERKRFVYGQTINLYEGDKYFFLGMR